MKKFKLNPLAKDIDLTYVFDAKELDSIGWDFDTGSLEDYAAIVRITNESGKIWTGVELNKWTDQNNRISNGTMEHTGDDDQTIEDLISYINENEKFFTDGHLSDMSTNSRGNYVSTFICS